MNHSDLDSHQIIAWDMDGTLVDGPNAAFFRKYILANPQKEHHIVTFRTGPSQAGLEQTWAQDAIDELESYGVPRGTIKAVHSVPDNLFAAYANSRTLLVGEELDQFMCWKGKTAKSFGATVLVDDMEMMVIKGCDLHDVDFVHSHDPIR